MKARILFGATLLVLLLSCQKKEINPANNAASGVNSSQNAQNVAAKDPESPYRIFWDFYPYCCTSTGGNCLDDVVVTPLTESIIDVVIGGVQEDIREAFSNNYQALAEILIRADLDNVISGDLLATVVSNGTGGNQFLVLRNSSEVIVRVYPFVE